VGERDGTRTPGKVRSFLSFPSFLADRAFQFRFIDSQDSEASPIGFPTKSIRGEREVMGRPSLFQRNTAGIWGEGGDELGVLQLRD